MKKIMPYNFKLRISKKEISHYASKHEYNNEDIMCNEIAPKIQKQKYLTKKDLIFICRWKSPRILKGVSWPVASVILHFGKKNLYPILDYRALWSLGIKKPNFYNFDLWISYVSYCRKLVKELKIDMRTLDMALWQFSKEKHK
jgi:hypothetical protein